MKLDPSHVTRVYLHLHYHNTLYINKGKQVKDGRKMSQWGLIFNHVCHTLESFFLNCPYTLYMYIVRTYNAGHSTESGHRANCPSNCISPRLLCFLKWKCQSISKIWLPLFCRIPPSTLGFSPPPWKWVECPVMQ
jgi:hypothetical protein